MMREIRICCLFMLIMMFAGMSSFGSVLAENGSLAMSVYPAGSAEPGSEIVVSFDLSGNPGISLLSFDTTYDSEKLTYVSSEDGVLTGWVVDKSVAGELRCFWMPTNSSEVNSSNGTILKLKFTVSENASGGKSTFSISNFEAYDADRKAADFGGGGAPDISGSEVTIQSTVIWKSQDGTVTYETDSGLDYEAVISYDGNEPSKDADLQYTYEFAGWATETGQESGKAAANLDPVTGDITYYAAFSKTEKVYTVRLNPNGGTGNVSSQSFPFGTAKQLAESDFTREGFILSGWNTVASPDDANPGVSYALDASLTFNEGLVTDYISKGYITDETYLILYAQWTPVYTVTWKSQDGSTTYETDENLPAGTAPSFDGTAPVKNDDEQFTYTFEGWAEETNQKTGKAVSALDSVSANKTYYAAFSETVRKYTITWIDGDRNTLKTEELAYGSAPAYTGNTPTKTATDQYTYSFSNNWDPAIETVTKEQTYTAQFTGTVKEYEIKWVDGNGNTLKTEQLAYGETPAYIGDTPTKTETDQYTYTFSNTWDPAIGTVTKAQTYTAQFTGTVKEYEIKWVDGNGATLKTEQLAYGTTPVYTGSTPTKTATDQYTYTFSNTWSPAIESVTRVQTYTAQFSSSVVEYVITWIDGDENTLKTENVAYGETPAYTGDTPTKTATEQNSYTFTNTWLPAIETVTKAQSYTAQFNTTVREYAITWVDGDGNTLKTEQLSYGETPAYTGNTPTKTATEQYTYTFSNNWDPAIETVTKAQAYTAQFNSSVNEYTITWVDGNGNTLKTEQLAYGSTPAYSGDAPTKTATEQYTYSFNDTWNPAIETVTKAQTYTAQFNSSVNEYMITWIDGNGNTLKTEQLAYGSTPAYSGDTPTKTGTDQYTYTFSNTWTPAIETVTKAQSYTAQFNSSVVEYEITWIDGDGNILKTENVAYGVTPSYTGTTPTKTATDQYTYTFSNTWSPAIETVTKAQSYTAQFNNSVNMYTITWVDGDGNTLKTDQLNYGETPSYTGDTPTKQPDADYTYTFSGWSPDISTVTGNQTFIAKFDSSVRQYGSITWVDGNGGTLKTDRIPFDDMPVYSGETPTKASTEEHTYIFNGKWSPEITAVAGDQTYTAQFDERTPMYVNVTLHNYVNSGAKGVPGDIPTTDLNLNIIIKQKVSGEEVSRASIPLSVTGGGNNAKIELENVQFDRSVTLSSSEFDVMISGPNKLTGAAPISQIYSLSYDAWVTDGNLITIYLKWDDGKNSQPEVVRVYALPEDEIGAYHILPDGTKEYLLFHTYDICMAWLGSDELCRGPERCFHKSSPYENPFVTESGLIEEHMR